MQTQIPSRSWVTGVVLAAAVSPACAQTLPRVVISTTVGSIEIEIDTANAPITGMNFLAHVDAQLYSGGSFYRTVTMSNQPNSPVKIEVIQGGLGPTGAGANIEPIPLERTEATGLEHHDGTISMARAGPDTGTTEFFICIGDQPALDFGGARNPDGQGFAAFGRVVRGMDIVRAIHAGPVDGQRLTPAIQILSIQRS